MSGGDKNGLDRGPGGFPTSARSRGLDVPGRLLAYGVRWMPGEYHDWGVAMQTELAQIQPPMERWRFALGCTGVALFPPSRSGLIRSVLYNTMNGLANRPRASALIGLTLALPIPILLMIAVFEIQPLHGFIKPLFTEADGVRQKVLVLAVLFAGLLVMPVASIITLSPVLRSVRAGNRASTNLGNMLLGIGIFLIFASLLGGSFIDQLPCFLDVPNCD